MPARREGHEWVSKEEVCEVSLCQKSMCGRARERERALDDTFEIWVMVRNGEKTLQKMLKFSDWRRSVRKQIRPSWGKTSVLILCLLGFRKATKFRDSREFSECVQNVLTKSCLPCQCLHVTPKKVSRARKGLGTASPTVLSWNCKKRFSLLGSIRYKAFQPYLTSANKHVTYDSRRGSRGGEMGEFSPPLLLRPLLSFFVFLSLKYWNNIWFLWHYHKILDPPLLLLDSSRVSWLLCLSAQEIKLL